LHRPIQIPSLRAEENGGNWCKIGLTHSDSISQSCGQRWQLVHESLDVYPMWSLPGLRFAAGPTKSFTVYQMLSLKGLWQLWQRQGHQQKLALPPSSSLVSLIINLAVQEREQTYIGRGLHTPDHFYTRLTSAEGQKVECLLFCALLALSVYICNIFVAMLSILS
jgi:hypothetical protein